MLKEEIYEVIHDSSLNEKHDCNDVIITSIDSLFSKVKIDEKGTGEESTLGNNDPTTLEHDQSYEIFDKSGFGRS